MASRRRFLLALGAMSATSRSWGLSSPFRRAKLAPVPTYRVYFGTDTQKGAGKGIYRAMFNAKTGELTQLQLAAATEQPSFLAVGPAAEHRVLYAVNESGNAVVTFRVEPQSGDLQRVGQVSSGTAGPCYVAIDATGHAAFTANYAGGGGEQLSHPAGWHLECAGRPGELQGCGAIRCGWPSDCPAGRASSALCHDLAR